jgi:hypothetical protein
MIALARFIMAGPSQATLVTAVMALLAFIIPPLGWLSAAAVAVVVLQLGPQRGIQLIALAAVASMALAWLALGSPMPVFGLILMLWLPVWLAATVLRSTVSLNLTLQVITALGLLFVLVLQLGFPQMQAELAGEFSQVIEQLMQQQPDDTARENLARALDMVLQMTPAILAAGMMLSTVIGLLLGRWWQAVLYNPGGFAREFNQLRLGRVLAAITTVMLLLAISLDVKLLMLLLIVLLTIYLIQGLAVVQGIIDARGLNRAWLFGLYVGLFLLPHMVALPLAVFGLMDAWIDFRRRLTAN